MGGDNALEPAKTGLERFNPRPRMGGDVDTGGGLDINLGFNPRPRMGGDNVK